MNHAPTDILMLTADEIMRLVTPRAAIDALADGFKALSRGEVHAPPRPKILLPGKGFVLAMLASAPGLHHTEKTACVYHDNPRKGLASHQVTISLFDEANGVPIALLEGGSITALRTTGGAMLSIEMLSRPDADIVTVLGGGVEAVEHVRQLHALGRFREIRVWARRHEAARAVAAAAPGARAVEDLEANIRASGVVCMTTGAPTPVIDDRWISPGTHVASVGYAPPGTEVPSALIDRAALFVETADAFEPAPVGCAELAGRNRASGAELGEVLLGKKPGRTSREQVTLYKSMGHAMEDLFVANLAYRVAIKAGAGTKARI